MKRLIFGLAASLLFLADGWRADAGYVIFGPHATVYGVDGDSVVGAYSGGVYGSGGFLFNGSTVTNLPGMAVGVDGNNVVGISGINSYLYNGSTTTAITQGQVRAIAGNYILGPNFLYNISTSTYTTFPGSTSLSGLDANNVVGQYSAGGTFVYNIATSTYTNVNLPPQSGNLAISGNNISGQYSTHSLVYNFATSTFTTIDVPGAFSTHVNAISGNNIVGYYYVASGSPAQAFVDNFATSTFTTLDVPGSTGPTTPFAVSGNRVVGETTINGVEYGFLYDPALSTDFTVNVPFLSPEPSTFALLGIGIAGMAGYGWRRRKSVPAC